MTLSSLILATRMLWAFTLSLSFFGKQSKDQDAYRAPWSECLEGLNT